MADRPCAVCGKALTRRQALYCSRACYLARERQPLEERFWRFVGEPDADGCREWTGFRDGLGRGKFSFKGRPVKAHRMAYELAVGPIPPGLKVCHSCDNPPCCESTHLFLGTQADNVADMVRKGRQRFGEHQRRKTHCSHGHEFSEQNTRLYRGRRVCRTCEREHVLEQRKEVSNG
jgi:hypothetical protein